jgi:hypothetical protein
MGVYTTFKDSYAQETTWADDSTLDDTNDTAYKWGNINENSVYNIRSSLNFRAPGFNAKETPSGNTWKGNISVDGMLGVILQNGIVCWATMGSSSTAGSDPYTHTIGPYTDGTVLPSFVMHHERSGTATTKTYQILGMKVNNLLLKHDTQGADCLLARVGWIAKKAQKADFTLTNTPALPATANEDPYQNLSVTFNSVNVDGLQDIEIGIDNNLTGHWGSYGDRHIRLITEKQKKYIVRMVLHPSTIEDDFFDEIVASGTEYDIVAKWQRSTNDYIQVTASGTLTEAPFISPLDHLLEEVVFEPRAIAIEVKDSIAGSAYGE